jgi:Tfp pilus assembly PilM family ATPase
MSKRQVLVEITPDHVDVVRYDGGKRGTAKRIDVSLPNEATDWVEALGQYSKVLRQAVESLGVEGAAATVLYRSPTQSVDLSSYKSSTKDACDAARLEVVQSLPYDEHQAVCSVTTAGRDSGKGGACHIVAAAERDDVAEAVASFVDNASMEYVSAAPIDAATMARLVGVILRRGGEDRGWLHVGEHTSFFLITQNKKLIFARQMGLGVVSITSSLTRPIKRRGGDSIELDMTAARKILHEFGIPGHDVEVDAEHELRGFHLTPLMQPVLQRMVVELRQSVRFGLTDEQRQRLTITLKGPGAAIPNLEKLLAAELGMPVEQDTDAAAYDWATPGCRGTELAEAVQDRRLLGSLSLIPRTLTAERRATTLKRWLWIGAAVAMLASAGEWFHRGSVLADTRRQAQAVETQASEQDALVETNSKLSAVIKAFNELEYAIDQDVGRQVDYLSILHEVGRLAPKSVRVKVLRINQSDRRPRSQLVAFASDAEGTGRADVSLFVGRLRESPLFAEVDMGAMQTTRVGSSSGHKVNIDIVCVEPRHRVLAGFVSKETQ